MYRSRQNPLKNKNYVENRVIRAEIKTQQRRISRHSTFASNRNIEADLIQEDAQKANNKGQIKNSRLEKLLEWKKKKEELKKREAESKTKEKPPFKCGFVHHKPPSVLYVPPVQRRSQRIQNITSNKTVHEQSKIQHTQPKIFKRCTKSFAPKQHEFKAPNNLPKIDEVCDSVSTPEEKKTLYSFVVPVQHSPWFSHRRGSGHGQKASPFSEELFANKDLRKKEQVGVVEQVEAKTEENLLSMSKAENIVPKIIISSPKMAITTPKAENLIPRKLFMTSIGRNIITAQYTETPKSILKRGDSLSARKTINIDTNTKGDVRVSRTPFRVKFSDDNLSDSCGMKHPATPGIRSSKGTPAVKRGLRFSSVENSEYSNCGDDLIFLDSPLRDSVPVRKSPRLRNRI